VRHVRAPSPVVFPEAAKVPESKSHLTLRTFLYQLLHFALGPEHSVGSEQFVYWNAADASRCLAPAVFVKLDVPDQQFRIWQTWERGGAPDLAVEIVSPTEWGGRTLDQKLAAYHELGVKELVRFDPEAPEGKRLRVWDRVEGDLVERVIAGDRTPCLTLDLNWTVCLIGKEPVGLRLVDDAGRLLETREERADARAATADARAATADARIRELEEELARRSKQTGGNDG
jgi:Uma2 family endonuclease